MFRAIERILIVLVITMLLYGTWTSRADSSYEQVACVAEKYMEINGFMGKEGDKYHPYFHALFQIDFVDNDGNLVGTWADLWKRRRDYIADPVFLGISERTGHYVVVYRAIYLGRKTDEFCIRVDKGSSSNPHMGSFGCLPHFGYEALDSSKWILKYKEFDPENDCPVS